MDSAEFKSIYPEFSNADDDLIDSELELAEDLCPASVWGDGEKRERGIGLTVAKALALSPAGRGMELVSDGVTVYDQRLEELQSVVAGGGRVL